MSHLSELRRRRRTKWRSEEEEKNPGKGRKTVGLQFNELVIDSCRRPWSTLSQQTFSGFIDQRADPAFDSALLISGQVSR